MSVHTPTITERQSRLVPILLWTTQVLLAAVFLMAGVAKLSMPIDELARQSGLPGSFLRFIAVAELTGACGLVLPGIFRVHRGLTPLAARGLLIIMVGAVITSAVRMGLASAVLPLVVGCLLVTVIRGRRSWAPASRSAAHGALASSQFVAR